MGRCLPEAQDVAHHGELTGGVIELSLVSLPMRFTVQLQQQSLFSGS